MTALGAQYYRPPNPPREDWPRDLAAMAAAGMNTVKLWACWSWMEPRPGEYDFADLDELLDLAHANGLRVVINTIVENAPYWLEEQHPEARYQDAEGRPVHLTAAMNTPGGGWPGLCFDNAPVTDAAHAFLAALVERYDAHPALDAWDVWNEPHLEPASYFPDRIFCYCAASQERFGSWLRERHHGDLDELDAAWERRYSSWSQVAPPRVFESVPDMMQWREYWFENLAGWLRDRVDVVRARARRGRTVMTHVALSGFTGQLATHTLDEFTLTGPVDRFGTSSFPTWLMADDHVEHLFNLETARDAAAGKPFWQAELQGGRGRRDGIRSTGQPDPAVVRLWIWNALATGATGVVFWQWRPELLGPESPGYGLTAPDGAPTERVAAVTAMSNVTALPELEGRVHRPGPVGLLLSRRSALHGFATDRTMDLVTRASLGAYRLLLGADVDVTILHEDRVAADGVPDHVDAVYWPMPAVSDESLAQPLSRFVHRGGHLVAESGPGEYEPLGRRRTAVPGGTLGDLFGAREVESTSTAPGRLDGSAGSIAFDWQRADVTIDDDAEVAARFEDGGPAIVTARRGAGRATLIATYPSLAEADERSSRALAGLLGAEPGAWDEVRPGLISRRATTADGRPLVFAVNWTGADALYRASGTTITTQGVTTHAGAVTIPARSGALILAGDHL